MSGRVTGTQTNVGAQQIGEIRDRLRLAFSSSYLTLLSIIQGTALAVLFAKIDHLMQGPPGFGASQALMALGLFLLIILIWHQCQLGVMLRAAQRRGYAKVLARCGLAGGCVTARCAYW